MRFCFLLLGIGLFFLQPLMAQSLQGEDKKAERKTNEYLKEAEEDLAENDFPSAEASYRKAVSKNPESVKAKYNMANMYYSKEKPSQAENRLKQAAKVAETKGDKHQIYHNLGNTFMEQKKYKEAVEAYKNALRNNPSDEETRYNLALAKKMLEEDEQENEGGGDENEDEQEQDQDEGEQEQDKQEGEDKQDQGGESDEESQQEPEQQDDQGEPKEEEGTPDQPEPQQPQPGQLSPEQIKSLLEAMNNEEKKVQEKMNLEKAKGAKTRTGKDW